MSVVSCVRIALAAAALGFCLCAAPGHAETPARPALQTAPPPEADSPEIHRFDGNHTGVVAGVTTTALQREIAGIANRGYGFRVGARLASVLQIADLELTFEHVKHGARAAADASWTRNEGGLLVSLHPGFPFAVFNSYFYDVVAGFHGYVGASMARATLRGTAGLAQARTDGQELFSWQPSLAVGLGLDVPLTPRGLSSGLWLTLRYGLRWMGFGPHDPNLNLADSQAMVELNWRFYDTSWARLPRPF